MKKMQLFLKTKSNHIVFATGDMIPLPRLTAHCAHCEPPHPPGQADQAATHSEGQQPGP